MKDGLKLYAIDADDLTVMSAALEGAITSPGEISYSSKSRQLTLTASRVRWENDADPSKGGSRIRCGVLITDIISIRAKSIPQDNPTMGMELLSILSEPGEDGGSTLTFNFADDKTLSLEVECINAALTDVGDPWDTEKIPTHNLES